MTKQADYGFVLLACVASSPSGSVHAARDLAVETHLPPPMVSKILKALVRGGLLTSHRGVRGGYSLARPSAQISLADVIDALDGGPLSMTECLGTEPGACDHEQNCRVKHHWRTINEAVLGALSRVSLAELAAPSMPVLVNLDLSRRVAEPARKAGAPV